MAEVAPLTSAHTHARNAAQSTKTSQWEEAAREHSRAASDLGRATKDTGDHEALRTLRLLEAQHQKLAQIIKSQATAHVAEVATTLAESSTTKPRIEDRKASEANTEKPVTANTKPATKTTSALAAARLISRTRESSPSLARDIASRRGIPQPSKVNLVQAAGGSARQTSPDARRRAAGNVPPQIPTSVMESQRKLPRRPHKPDEEDGFASFYSIITNGTMSKLSSVLAYAGLPLTSEEAIVPEPETTRKEERRTVTATNDPDVKRLISKAALKAVEDSHHERGTPGHVFGPAESFYVVQTGGGTYSYADIAKARTQLSNIGEDDEDSFVDAREAQARPSSPHHSRASTAARRSSFGKNRTAEELELENTTLKTTLEHLASRLQNFEVHAQDASMMAMSMASLHHSPTQPHHPPQQDAATRVKELEAQMREQGEQTVALEKMAEKQERKIRAYHAKWEELKKSAKEKERVRKERAEGVGKEGEGEEG
nr:hypothetical protein B0A51_02586 [Rachicladosporium sp. CCFEE 5018]